MSIRLRHIEGIGLVALCAARSVPKDGDLYLDDNVHHALAEKFREDFTSEGAADLKPDREHARARAREEANNPNRDWWDKVFGDKQ